MIIMCLKNLPDTSSRLMTWFMREVDKMISSNTGTLPPVKSEKDLEAVDQFQSKFFHVCYIAEFAQKKMLAVFT